jgi:GR25 family glycosyltransferase involved in LPS biosynthesis
VNVVKKSANKQCYFFDICLRMRRLSIIFIKKHLAALLLLLLLMSLGSIAWLLWIPSTEHSKYWQSIHLPASTHSLGFDQIYVLNLKKRPDRLKYMSKMLHLLGAKFKVIEALDGKDNSTQKEMVDWPYRNSMSADANLAIKMTHYFALRDAYENNYRDIIILEDDCDLDFSMPQLLPLLKKQLPSDWDIVPLYGNAASTTVSPDVQRINNGTEGIPFFFGLAFAYSQKGIKAIKKAIENDIANVWDFLLGLLIKQGDMIGYRFTHEFVDRIDNDARFLSDHTENEPVREFRSNLRYSVFNYLNSRDFFPPLNKSHDK